MSLNLIPNRTPSSSATNDDVIESRCDSSSHQRRPGGDACKLLRSIRHRARARSASRKQLDRNGNKIQERIEEEKECEQGLPGRRTSTTAAGDCGYTFSWSNGFSNNSILRCPCDVALAISWHSIFLLPQQRVEIVIMDVS